MAFSRRSPVRVRARQWLQDQRRLLLGCDAQSDQMRARILRVLIRLSPWTLAASLVVALVMAQVLRPYVGMESLLVWMVIQMAVCAAGWLAAWRQRGRVLRAAPAAMVRGAIAQASLLGLCWALPAVLWFSDLPHEPQLFVGLITVCMMAGGVVGLALLAPAALSFLVVMLLGAQWALWKSSLALALHLAALNALFAAVLMLGVLAAAQLFSRRLMSEREAARQGEVVSLLLRDFEESSSDVLWEIDRHGRFVQVSRRLATLLERPIERLPQLSLVQILQSLQQEGSRGVERLQHCLNRGEPFRDQVVRVRLASGIRWWSITAKPVSDERGRAGGWRGVIADVTAERQSHQHLAYLAHFDSLTGLSNRVSVRNRLAQAVEPGSRRSALLCLDLDHFKTINDSHGHSVGDAVLQEVAKRLRAYMRKSDLCGRLGGDEFAIVLDDLRSDDEALALAERLVAALRLPHEIQNLSLSTGVSIGVAFLPDHGDSVDEALASADLALYAAKAAGRGRVECFTSELGTSQRRRMTLERELREALARNELVVHYQPQVDLQTWTIRSAEALVRWNHPTLGSVSPGEFIPVAEDTGLINNIGAWVLAKACSDAKHVLPGLRIAVNASAAQVQRAAFVNELRSILSRYQLSPEWLEVEITESLLMEDVNSAVENLHAIKELGVRIALDDFGTGYSSLAYLRRFPFDKLKIDRAFIRELMTTSDARAIVRTILQLAGVLGMDTVAEGVEEPAQLDVLAHVGCHAIQGFLVARPMPAEELADLCRRWESLPRPESAGNLPESVLSELRLRP
ncbi:diguanylate cyclase (GGDEF)-like protein/PAS domain S-box-containing protein [Inhella inkyongensis]|uniref:Diguanylate cyclase (GGDEF)-like protein/PAS domain S-box-containing protein n=1 Tax=Inhella inkyongensis TaxID=392593 RepID=A0A840SCD9_9BURK|nr:EAL domain-containing protein [Inhella inkyongensis]MBB5206424.1 diguanylate cyclase (GGDEF)-like protein/PAS domain S-box-containing protein [Inhella inkyongensis]